MTQKKIKLFLIGIFCNLVFGTSFCENLTNQDQRCNIADASCLMTVTTDSYWMPAAKSLPATFQPAYMIKYRDHFYLSGQDVKNPNLCSAVYSYQGINQWKPVGKGVFMQSYLGCYTALTTMAVYNGQLYGAVAGFSYIYNGDDENPYWTNLGIKGFDTIGDSIQKLVSYHNKLYALVSTSDPKNSGLYVQKVYVYHSANQTWSAVSRETSPLANGFFVYHDKLYLTYLSNPYALQSRSVLAVYNGNDHLFSWSDAYVADASVTFTGVEVLNDTLFIMGSVYSQNPSSTQGFVKVFNENNPQQSIDISNGLPVTPVSEGFNYSSVTAVGSFGNLLYAGGTNAADGRAFVYKFNNDLVHPNWVEADTGIPVALDGSGVAQFSALNSQLFVLGELATRPSGSAFLYTQLMNGQ